VLGYGSLSGDGLFPQLHSDDLTLLPEEECGGLQTAYGRWWSQAPANSGPSIQACTGAAARLAGMRLGWRLGSCALTFTASGRVTLLKAVWLQEAPWRAGSQRGLAVMQHT